MKKKIFLFKTLFFCTFFWINNLNATIQNKIVANVGNGIISAYELKNEIKTTLFLTNKELNQNNISASKNIALRSLIDSKLKQQELLKFDISIINDPNIGRYLNKIASNYNTDKKGLEILFKNNSIDFEQYLNSIKIELAWQKLIFKKYINKIDINEKEIESEVQKIINNNEMIKEYKLAEIEILVENNFEKENKIKEIQDQIKIEGFENTAIKFSASSTSLDGGELGWINSKSLSDDILTEIEKLKIGEISKPILKTNSVLFLKLTDKKNSKIEIGNIENIKNQVIKNKQNEMLNLFSNNYLSQLKNSSLIQINYEK